MSADTLIETTENFNPSLGKSGTEPKTQLVDSESSAARPTLVIGDRLKPGYRGTLPDLSNVNDLYWLAGLLEGEGYFHIYGRNTKWPHPRIQLQMTDEDVVKRAAILFGGNKVRKLNPASNGYQHTYRTEVAGRPAAHLMVQLKPIMGKRRRNKIDEILQEWLSRDNLRSAWND